ncbi:hypothetical protein L1887_49489 [Cichorium endivia]|nr:hypothetical protein L1887_49489 [Cichorium endivia]
MKVAAAESNTCSALRIRESGAAARVEQKRFVKLASALPRSHFLLSHARIVTSQRDCDSAAAAAAAARRADRHVHRRGSSQASQPVSRSASCGAPLDSTRLDSTRSILTFPFTTLFTLASRLSLSSAHGRCAAISASDPAPRHLQRTRSPDITVPVSPKLLREAQPAVEPSRLLYLRPHADHLPRRADLPAAAMSPLLSS